MEYVIEVDVGKGFRGAVCTSGGTTEGLGLWCWATSAPIALALGVRLRLVRDDGKILARHPPEMQP